jgi:ABC-type Fe3+-hydroxamate transport system substrate-binding protein
MADDASDHDAPTRRQYLAYGSAAAAGSFLAGCMGSTDDGSDATTTGDDTETSTESTTESGDGETQTTAEDGSYSVSMSPMGTVEFDEVPERVVSFDDQWFDHMVALGQADKLVGLGRPDGYFTAFYDRLPGVSVDMENVQGIWGEDSVDSELLYELDADVHHIDPLRAVDSLDGLDEKNVERIQESVGPFFANRGSRANNVPGGANVDYEFYSLWETLSKYAQVYRVEDRSAALRAVRDEMVSHIQSELPPESERPTVALAQFWEGEFYVYDPNKPGFGSAHTRPVKLKDALPDVEGYASSNWQTAPISKEAMLEADPDVFVSHNAVGLPEYYEDTAVPNLKDDPVVSQITAVKNDRIYPGGLGLQGPLFCLFQIEMTAKQVYPEKFGEFPGLGEPVPESEQLFDRQHVADIVNGDV